MCGEAAHGIQGEVHDRAVHETKEKIRGNRTVHRNDQQAREVEWKDPRQRTGALRRLRRTGGGAAERNRLVRVVAGAGGKMLRLGQGDLTKLVWGLAGVVTGSPY